MGSWKFSGSAYVKRLTEAGYFAEPTRPGRRQKDDRERRLKHDERGVLRVLIITANEEGICYRKLATIAELCSYHPKSVSWALRGLRNLGLLEVQGQTEHGVPIYRITMPERERERVGWNQPKRPSVADAMAQLEHHFGRLSDEERRDVLGALAKLTQKALDYRAKKSRHRG